MVPGVEVGRTLWKVSYFDISRGVKNFRLFKSILISIMLLVSCEIFAAKGAVATASFTLIGRVPEVFSVSAQSTLSELDLDPGTSVNLQKIGNIRFKYNEDVAGINISSSTVSGKPENTNEQSYVFARPFTLSILGQCRSLDMSEFKDEGITLKYDGEDYKSQIAANLKTGIDEDCQLAASYSTESRRAVKSRSEKTVYSMNIIVTMVSL